MLSWLNLTVVARRQSRGHWILGLEAGAHLGRVASDAAPGSDPSLVLLAMVALKRPVILLT